MREIFISSARMEAIMRSGRLKKSPTIGIGEIYSQAGCPPEAVLAPATDPMDRSLDDLNDNVYGVCWAADIERVLEIAAREGDTDLRNPNLPILRLAFETMTAMRETRQAFQERMDAIPGAEIIPLRP